ncbi:MAG: DUF438 domain-containing protein [Candidatus Bathyarchaeia archaeon]|nr:DUF438 domain-containing protein [Candidatus Bathyarchaeota archaeon A05DMB-4]MDH7595093.1 DUF438 domain-containing protein [Candidatus Bathyarchaeota archaeon]
MSEIAEQRKKILKEIIKRLHEGASPEEVKEKFKHVLEGTSQEDIAKVEQELVKEGMPREEVRRLCDVHLAVFSEQLEKRKLQVPLEHPVGILMEEHKIMLQLAEKLNTIAEKVYGAEDASSVSNDLPHIEHISNDFTDSEKHYLREENVLFPLLEKHGITEPPAIMWMEHDKIRAVKKQLRGLVEKRGTMNFQDFKEQLHETAKTLGEFLSSHFFKENNILFPAAMQVVTSEEWEEAKKEFSEIGYCCFTPPTATVLTQPKEMGKAKAEGLLQFETGALSKEELEAILNTLPVDITFVDANDQVRYYSEGGKRVFVRTKAVIGRKVQLCHPQKSIHIVNRILESFKSGKKDVAEFWIQMAGRLIHIRYFAVRDKNRKYLGTIEVTQDITDIKKIEGERRLLDWKD